MLDFNRKDSENDTEHYSAMLLNHKISGSVTLCKFLPLKHSRVHQIEIPKQKPYFFIPLRMDLGG